MAPDHQLESTQNGPVSDKELIEKVKCGDTFAFNILVDRYKIRLFNLVYRMKRRKKFKFFSLDLIKNNREYATPQAKNNDCISSALEKAIHSLPVKYRTAFLLRDVDQLSYEEVSKSMGIPLGTVKSRVNRARLLLRDKLEPKIKGYYELSKSSPLSIQLL